MPTFIADTLGAIDGAVEGYAETVFTELAGPLTTTVQAGGVVALGLLAANAMYQVIPIRFTEFIKWGLRYVVILAVVTSWAQFEPIYDILTNVPGSIGAALLGYVDAPNLNEALDEMVTALFEYSERANEQSGWFSISLASILLLVLGALMACVAILVSAIGKVGLAMAVSLAPVFIATLLFRATSDLFTSWSRFTIGFALIPLVLAGVMGAVLGVGSEILRETNEVPATLVEAAGFIIIAMAAIFMMSQVPSLVFGLAGSLVATASGIREAQTVALAGTNVARPIAREGTYQAVKAASGVGAAREAGRQGGGPSDRVKALFADAKIHAKARDESSQRYQERMAAFGREAERSGIREAGRAGGRQSMRNARRDRDDRKRRPDSTED